MRKVPCCLDGCPITLFVSLCISTTVRYLSLCCPLLCCVFSLQLHQNKWIGQACSFILFSSFFALFRFQASLLYCSSWLNDFTHYLAGCSSLTTIDQQLDQFLSFPSLFILAQSPAAVRNDLPSARQPMMYPCRLPCFLFVHVDTNQNYCMSCWWINFIVFLH